MTRRDLKVSHRVKTSRHAMWRFARTETNSDNKHSTDGAVIALAIEAQQNGLRHCMLTIMEGFTANTRFISRPEMECIYRIIIYLFRVNDLEPKEPMWTGSQKPKIAAVVWKPKVIGEKRMMRFFLTKLSGTHINLWRMNRD